MTEPGSPITTLPEPAGGVWRHASRELLRQLTNRIPDFDGWKLAGGTILAAQWEHRESTDIDLKVAPKTGLARLDPRYDPGFDDAMERLGAARPIHRKDQIIIPFSTGKIDIFEGATRPRIGHRTACIDGHSEDVLSNAQILAGKLLGRGLESPTRDLFDIAVAAETDSTALEIAINCLGEGTWRETTVRWEETAPHHAAAARTVLRNIPARWESVADDPAGAAIERAARARYDKVTIRWSDGRLEVETKCPEQQPRVRILRAKNRRSIANDLERYGINAYLDVATWTRSSRILDEIESADDRRLAIVHETPGGPNPGPTTDSRDEKRGGSPAPALLRTEDRPART